LNYNYSFKYITNVKQKYCKFQFQAGAEEDGQNHGDVQAVLAVADQGTGGR
jgi:hypothetical protein